MCGAETRAWVFAMDCSRAGIWLLVILLALAEGGVCVRAPQVPADPNQLFQQLNEVQLDTAHVYALRDTMIARDRVKLYFNRGFMVFLAPVAGEVTGAVFVGQGEALLMPPTATEKQSLAQFTEAAVLNEPFTSAYLRFTDDSARELRARARPPDPDATEQPEGRLAGWEAAVRQLNSEHSLRILQDLLGRRDRPFFHVRLQGVKLGAFQVLVDERMPESVMVGAIRENGQRLYRDVWCSFASRVTEARDVPTAAEPFRVVSYQIDTHIADDHYLKGRAQLVLEMNSEADRMLVFGISPRLNVSEVRDEMGNLLPVFVRPVADEVKEAALRHDLIAVTLPKPPVAGRPFRLDFAYQGNVITEVGTDLLYVEERSGWYPSLGFGNPAPYDLTFHFPAALTLVATGRRLAEETADGVTHSHWVSDGPILVAGFNLGRYEATVRRAKNAEISVYVTRVAERDLEQQRVAQSGGGVAIVDPLVRGSRLELLPKPPPPLAPAHGLTEVADQALRAVNYFESIFGPFPYRQVSVSQLPARMGQGWPQLVYLPTLSFLLSSEPSGWGEGATFEELNYRLAAAHEIAHQWWGNFVGWKSYHDQWLSEGFASYAAALFLANEPGGERNVQGLLRAYKQRLLGKTKEGKTIESGGPIWLGERLSNSLNPQGYENIVYLKACWVLRMLHRLMTDPAKPAEDRFFLMLRDFVRAYGGKRASTEDFIRHAEKYMTPALDLERNHRLEWFFKPWVYETGIPTYRLTVKITPRGTNGFVIQGKIAQSGVDEDFEMLVPLLATFARGRKVRLGLVHVTNSGGSFRFTTASRPARINIDEDSILAVVQ